MALAWILKDKRVTSVLIGVSKSTQIIDSVKALDQLEFTNEELTLIEDILKS
jgi:L-glyceraldehyde 3-phosphate reductase